MCKWLCFESPVDSEVCFTNPPLMPQSPYHPMTRLPVQELYFPQVARVRGVPSACKEPIFPATIGRVKEGCSGLALSLLAGTGWNTDKRSRDRPYWTAVSVAPPAFWPPYRRREFPRKETQQRDQSPRGRIRRTRRLAQKQNTCYLRRQ